MAFRETQITESAHLECYCVHRAGRSTQKGFRMNSLLLKSFVKFQNLVNNEEGQDLVEYALVVAIIALGATASMQSLAQAISSAFASISTTFANAL
ncbi:MAG: Flp family type IVb pilin [Terracidiphilus sp.]